MLLKILLQGPPAVHRLRRSEAEEAGPSNCASMLIWHTTLGCVLCRG